MTKPDIRILPAIQPARMQEAPILGETEAQRVARIKAALDRIEARPGTTVHETIERMAHEEMQAIDDEVFASNAPLIFPLSIAVKRLTDSARVPVQGKRGDAGFDLFADEATTIYRGGRRTISTGIAVAIPEGYVGYIKPRSGLAHKAGIDVLGGVIDAGYRGEVKVILQSHDSAAGFMVNPGDRIAQLVIEHIPTVEYVEVEDLPDSERGQGGFGSTGTR